MTVPPEPAGEFVEIVSGAVQWRFETGFLQSNWTCIWGRGCLGILDEPAPELQQGCCSIGAELDDAEDAMTVSAYAATLDPAVWQFHDAVDDHDVFSDATRTNTKLVDGACIFLNRPGFSGGAGCALHLAALAADESPIDWKPSVCSQLPIHVDWQPLPDGRESATVRRWSRADWGPHGESMAWCCTEEAATYVGDRAVIDSLADELRAIAGDEVIVELRRRVRGATGSPHRPRDEMGRAAGRLRVMVVGPTSAPWEEIANEVEPDLARLRQHDVDVTYRCTGAGPRAIRSDEDALHAAPHVVRTVIAAAAQGADAVIIDCVEDPGVDAARAAVSIPVVGAGEGLRMALERSPGPIRLFTGEELRTASPEELVARARGAATVALGATGYSAMSDLFHSVDGVRVVLDPLDAALECCLVAVRADRRSAHARANEAAVGSVTATSAVVSC